ncbi:hypothetical protein HN587_06470 [Candidatus Woesearchaeota archaeon]|jgi:hypothetical protein|nr:hypothetical protein [Candidatus Woesearchaeota archaeon]
MKKKRVVLALILVVLVLALSSQAIAELGCCYTIAGCGFVDESACSGGFENKPCDQVDFCDVVACCHGQPELQNALYRGTCDAYSQQIGNVQSFFVSKYKTDYSIYESEATSQCSSGELPSCQYTSCGQASTYDCSCGTEATSAGNSWCCAGDNSVFSNKAQCLQSPSCQSTQSYALTGTVTNQDGAKVAGATITTGQKMTVSLEDGSYIISELDNGLVGTVIAAKGGAIQSKNFTINSQDAIINFNLTIQAQLVGEGEALISCENNYDDDKDQFNWNSTATGHGNYADICDSDCGTVNKTVFYQYYESQKEESCEDQVDNDCDGKVDCEDSDCNSNSACKPTFCGDNVTQFPNSNNLFEQCDAVYDLNGQLISGTDEVCPGQCYAPGTANQCTCKYEPVCGNAIIDEPQEQCDGEYNAVSLFWNPGTYVSLGAPNGCGELECGLPGSAYACQCPPPQLCGNGIVEAPEQCDPGSDETNFCPGAEGDEGCTPNCLCPQAPFECGNNLLEPGEDCDGMWDDETNVWSNFKTRKFGCEREYCGWPGIAINSEQIPGADEGEFFPHQCGCPSVCKLDPPGPNITNITTETFIKKFDLTWDDECGFEMNSSIKYNVYRCDLSNGDNCTEWDPEWAIIDTLLPNKREYEDTTIEPDKNYCYYIEGIYDTLESGNSIKPLKPLNIMCKRSGNSECYDLKNNHGALATEFCGQLNNNVRSTCDIENYIINVTDEYQHNCNEPQTVAEIVTNFVCVGYYGTNSDLEGKTRCVPESFCSGCGDPFGLFSFFPDAIYGEALEGGHMKRSCNLISSCFLDSSNTNVDYFRQIQYDFSCYDYHSERACFEDAKGVGNCGWNYSEKYGEIGIGVCKSNIVEEQECDRCHQHPNKIYGKCEKDICQLYGRCYYNHEDYPGQYTDNYDVGKADALQTKYDLYQCIPERETTCLSYDFREDCINSEGIYSLDGKNQLLNNSFDFNVTQYVRNNYDKKPIQNVNHGFISDVLGYKVNSNPSIGTNTFLKLNGTNKVLTKSDDYFGFGKCQWDGKGKNIYVDNGSVVEIHQYCGKNSDNDPNLVEYQSESLEDHKKTLEAMGINISEEDFSNFTQEQWNYFVPDCGYDPTWQTNINILDDLSCRKDFTNPTTTITHAPKIKGEFSLDASIFDDSLNYSIPIHYPKTYVCVVSSNNLLTDGSYDYCYPNGTSTKIYGSKNKVSFENVGYDVEYNFSIKGFETGWHRFYYFSEDISHNLEVVKNFSVFIDADAPNITFEFSNKSFEIFDDEWRTNLSMKMTTDENATCDTDMFINDNVSIYPIQKIYHEFKEADQSWEKVYDHMIDSEYRLWYRCEDEVGNVKEENITIIIDGDKSITNPRPKGTWNVSELYLRVNTGKSAVCKHMLHSSDVEYSGFEWNATMNMTQVAKESHMLSLFNLAGMQQFAEDTLGDEPSTLHRELEEGLTTGFYRYYVKCMMEEKARGNKGDEIRFAVDLKHPTTITLPDQDNYQGWYNADVNVELKCEDYPIYGLGYSWEFGCKSKEDTYYCIGRDCDEYENYFLYDNPIKFSEEGENYISFYSIDKGGNVEPVVENKLFNLDKTPANLTLQFFEGNEEEDIIRAGIPYHVIVTASKDFISPGVDIPKITYTSAPSLFTGEILLFPTNDSKVYQGFFNIPFINDNLGFEGSGFFSVEGHDNHNVYTTDTFEFPIDTKPPTQPVLSPHFDDYSNDELNYSLYKFNNTYYTNMPVLAVTGYTDELLDIITVSDSEFVHKNYTFTQYANPTEQVHDDNIILAFSDTHDIRVNGDITNLVTSDDFLGFMQQQEEIGPRRAYGDYGKFYDIVSVDYVPGDNQYTQIMVFPKLEESYNQNSKIHFYSKEYPLYWFNVELQLTPYRETLFYIKSYDKSGNLVRLPTIYDDPQVFKIFFDPDKPQVHQHYPNDGTTSENTFRISLIVTEDGDESGLNYDSVEFVINGGPHLDEIVPANITRLTELENNTESTLFYGKKVYEIFYEVSDLDDGTYDVSITATDLAGNSLSEELEDASWEFIVDQQAPISPEFSLVGGFSEPVELSLPDSNPRWYVNKPNPMFKLDFSENNDPVTVTSVNLFSKFPDSTDDATCSAINGSFNEFLCSFNFPIDDENQIYQDYSFNITAFKTLDDGTDSDDGLFGPFEFTIDQQAPNFTVDTFKTRIRTGETYTIILEVNNEYHPLNASFVAGPQEGEAVAYKQNGTTKLFDYDWNVNVSENGNHSYDLILSDFAGNSNDWHGSFLLDNIKPNFTVNVVNITNLFEINGVWYTSNGNLTLNGTVDSDTAFVWVAPGDYNETTETFDDKKDGTLIKKNGTPYAFTISIILSGQIGQEVTNIFTILVADEAGNIHMKNINIIQDLKQPDDPEFYIQQ